MGSQARWLTGVAVLMAGRLWAHDADTAAMQKRLGIPSFIAVVTDSISPNTYNLPDFILIQDIHRHPEVQSEIAAMILHGGRQWGAKTVFVEGAFEPLQLRDIAMNGRSKVLVEQLRKGELSGAQMAALMEPKEGMSLVGMEDADLYRQNVQAYNRTEGWRNPALQEIKTMRLLKASFGVAHTAISDEQLNRLELLVRLKLKPAEYEAFKADKISLPTSGALAEAVAGAISFYEFADKRSEAFLKKIDRVKVNGPKVIVVGGFHTAAMTAVLRAQGKSYAVLSPKITRSGYEELYAQRMHETIHALNLN